MFDSMMPKEQGFEPVGNEYSVCPELLLIENIKVEVKYKSSAIRYPLAMCGCIFQKWKYTIPYPRQVICDCTRI